MKKGDILLFAREGSRGSSHREKVECPLFGFSLLEIVLALAILAGTLAALGEVMRSASQSAALASDETQAQLLAESVMAELLAGARPLTATVVLLVLVTFAACLGRHGGPHGWIRSRHCGGSKMQESPHDSAAGLFDACRRGVLPR